MDLSLRPRRQFVIPVTFSLSRVASAPTAILVPVYYTGADGTIWTLDLASTAAMAVSGGVGAANRGLAITGISIVQGQAGLTSLFWGPTNTENVAGRWIARGAFGANGGLDRTHDVPFYVPVGQTLRLTSVATDIELHGSGYIYQGDD